MTRAVIIGNSGAGKSFLAARFGAQSRLLVHDLDFIHWEASGRKRDEAEAKAMVARLAAEPAWIIEGVYGWLAAVALPQATRLV